MYFFDNIKNISLPPLSIRIFPAGRALPLRHPACLTAFLPVRRNLGMALCPHPWFLCPAVMAVCSVHQHIPLSKQKWRRYSKGYRRHGCQLKGKTI